MTKKKTPRYCAQCGELIKGKGPCITKREWYHDECLPADAALQMMLHVPHVPGTPVTSEEFEEVSRWMTAESNRRIRTIFSDLTRDQALEISRRMMEAAWPVGTFNDDELDSRKKKIM